MRTALASLLGRSRGHPPIVSAQSSNNACPLHGSKHCADPGCPILGRHDGTRFAEQRAARPTATAPAGKRRHP